MSTKSNTKQKTLGHMMYSPEGTAALFPTEGLYDKAYIVLPLSALPELVDRMAEAIRASNDEPAEETAIEALTALVPAKYLKEIK
jgi:hypothetical protein